MNYRHIFHAGNFADVVKHVTLVALLEALARKDKGYCYVDTHAGIGLYPLTSDAARRTREFESGIRRLTGRHDMPELIARYCALVESFGSDRYPGSPCLARALLRQQDRAVLVELHPDDAAALKERFRDDAQTAVHHTDAYEALKAFVPPAERRGVVLVDPPFEQPGEFTRVVDGVARAHKRWPSGIYALWYPLKDRREVRRFHDQLQKTEIRRQLLIEFRLRAERPDAGLAGTGMIIINPPWQLEERLDPALRYLATHLADTDADAPAAVRREWLVPE